MQVFLTKAALLDRGWTSGAITSFLGEPDDHARNPRGRHPIHRYRLERVEAVEASEPFLAWKAGSQIKRDASRKRMIERVAATRAETMTWAKNVEIEVPKLSMDQLRRDAANFLLMRGETWAEPLPRHLLNHLRHRMTDYETLLDQTFGRIGKDDAVWLIRLRMLDLIRGAYPDLAKTCDEQWRRWKEISAIQPN